MEELAAQFISEEERARAAQISPADARLIEVHWRLERQAVQQRERERPAMDIARRRRTMSLLVHMNEEGPEETAWHPIDPAPDHRKCNMEHTKA